MVSAKNCDDPADQGCRQPADQKLLDLFTWAASARAQQLRQSTEFPSLMMLPSAQNG